MARGCSSEKLGWTEPILYSLPRGAATGPALCPIIVWECRNRATRLGCLPLLPLVRGALSCRVMLERGRNSHAFHRRLLGASRRWARGVLSLEGLSLRRPHRAPVIQFAGCLRQISAGTGRSRLFLSDLSWSVSRAARRDQIAARIPPRPGPAEHSQAVANRSQCVFG